MAPQAGIWGGSRQVWGEQDQDQAEETLRIPRASSGRWVSPQTQCRGTEGPSPIVARHNSNPSTHHEPSPVGEGKYSPGAPTGMFLPMCWSRALFPVTFTVLYKVPLPSPPPSPSCFPYMVSKSITQRIVLICRWPADEQRNGPKVTGLTPSARPPAAKNTARQLYEGTRRSSSAGCGRRNTGPPRPLVPASLPAASQG